jgi:hypothetical protein
MATQMVRLERSWEEVGVSAKQLIKRADTVGGRVEELERGPGMLFVENQELSTVKEIREEVV